MAPVPWLTKIEVVRNRQNKIDFQNLQGVASPVLARWAMYRVGVQ
jgi:hypothetical protein